MRFGRGSENNYKNDWKLEALDLQKPCFWLEGLRKSQISASPKTSPNVCENVFGIGQIFIKYSSGCIVEKTTKKKCKKTQKLCQKPSPKGEPRTWFSHPSAAKNDVLPAYQLLFRHFINLMFFSYFLWAPWNRCFTCMGAHFQRKVLPFVRFSY